jgi:hypothetical protein
MRGLADSWTSKQVGGWGPNSRLGSKMLPREGRANFEIPMCAESSLLWSYSRFFSYLQRFPEALSIGVRASLALPKRLGLLDTQARGTALPRWPRRHSQLAISPPQIAIRESQNLRWEMHTGILAAVRGTAESNGIKAVNLVAHALGLRHSCILFTVGSVAWNDTAWLLGMQRPNC